MSAALARRPGALTLSERLRRDTVLAHARLEAELDLLNGLTRERLIAVLQRFWSFHAGWEPAVARILGDPALTEPRRRLAAVEADLRTLCAPLPDEVWPAPSWLEEPAAAWGSLYVMEGSTLGGQVIGRALRAAGLNDLLYFDGRGADAGPMWRALKARIDEQVDGDAAAAGAVATFDALREWMRGV